MHIHTIALHACICLPGCKLPNMLAQASCPMLHVGVACYLKPLPEVCGAVSARIMTCHDMWPLELSLSLSCILGQ